MNTLKNISFPRPANVLRPLSLVISLLIASNAHAFGETGVVNVKLLNTTAISGSCVFEASKPGFTVFENGVSTSTPQYAYSIPDGADCDDLDDNLFGYAYVYFSGLNWVPMHQAPLPSLGNEIVLNGIDITRNT